MSVLLGRGLNIGGWISQSPLTTEHIRAFYTEDDARRIADWGFDNIRLPFDYPLLESDANPGQYSEEGFEWLDRGIEWAHRYGLKVILDMHRAPGFSFYNHASSTLLTDETSQTRFFRLWDAIARRYMGIRENLYFELLNEIVAPDAEQWNALAEKAVSAIRKTDPDRILVVGSNRWNAASTFNELKKFDDANIIYTFHFYEPFAFTHQKAGWEPSFKFYGLDVPYPGRPTRLEEAAERAETEGLKQIAATLSGWAKHYAAKEHGPQDLTDNLAQVIAFRQKYDAPVYCGEFGAIDTAPVPDRLRWHADMVKLFADHHIDWSLWSYKGMNFGVVDSKGKVASHDLLKILLG